jgi:hypothetical protein
MSAGRQLQLRGAQPPCGSRMQPSSALGAIAGGSAWTAEQPPPFGSMMQPSSERADVGLVPQPPFGSRMQPASGVVPHPPCGSMMQPASAQIPVNVTHNLFRRSACLSKVVPQAGGTRTKSMSPRTAKRPARLLRMKRLLSGEGDPQPAGPGRQGASTCTRCQEAAGEIHPGVRFQDSIRRTA